MKNLLALVLDQPRPIRNTGLLRLNLLLLCCLYLWQISPVAFANSMRVEVRGSGTQQLLLIPCAGCDWRSWETFMERNRQRYTMHAFTLPGLGGTARWPVAVNAQGTPLMKRFASEIASYMQEKRLRNVVIVGHSFGAAVALKTALDHPAGIAKLFLVDWGAVHPATLTITPKERLRQAESRRHATLQQTDEAFRKQMLEMSAGAIANQARVPVYADMFGKMDRLTSAQISYELRLYDWRPRLREIQIPVAAVFGLPEDEETAPVRRQAQAVLPGVRDLQISFLSQTGHWVMEERPQEFDRLIQGFVMRQSR